LIPSLIPSLTPVRLRLVLPLAAIALLVAAQTARRSTADGVYTAAQANAGRELWAAACNNCHTPHNGIPFKNKWMGRDLAALFVYTRNEMPKADPGSLVDEEVTQAIAYLMRVNGMPVGDRPLPSDSAGLSRIRFDSVRSVPTSTGPRR
jgi:S-disulfanyl-L-cysteine oxidoreductase SoxD